MSTFFIILLLLLLIASLYANYNLVKKSEKIEDKYLELYNSFCYIRDSFDIGYKVMQKSDKLGAFASDDETGTIFSAIKDTVEDLKKLTEIEEKDTNGPEEKK